MSGLSEWATHIMTMVSHGHLVALSGVFLIAAVMEVGVPIPFVLDSTILFVALDTGFISFPILLLVLALFIGRWFGSSILYWLGRTFGRVFLKWIKKRWPKVSERIDSFSQKLNQPPPKRAAHTGLAAHLAARLAAILRVPMVLVFARFTPGLLTVSSIAAGGICESYWIFVLGIGISSLLADALILTVGFLASKGLHILGVSPSVWQLTIGITILIAVGWALFFLIKRRLNKTKPKPKGA